MRNITSIIFLLGFLQIVSGDDVPRVIGYQGKLYQDGSPANGEYEIGYRIYDSADSEYPDALLWEQESHTVEIHNGIFSDTLGLRIDTVVASHNELWLEVIIEGVELIGRERLWASPWALNVPDNSITPDKISNGTQPGQILRWDGTEWNLILLDFNGPQTASSETYKLYRKHQLW